MGMGEENVTSVLPVKKMVDELLDGIVENGGDLEGCYLTMNLATLCLFKGQVFAEAQNFTLEQVTTSSYRGVPIRIDPTTGPGMVRCSPETR